MTVSGRINSLPVTSTRKFKYPCVAAGLFLGSAHHYPFLAIWKLLLYFRAANSKDKTLNINFRGRPVTFFLLIDLYSARKFFLLVQSDKVKNLKYSLHRYFLIHIPLNFTKNCIYARVLLLIFPIKSISPSILTIVALLLRHQVTRIRPIIWA